MINGFLNIPWFVWGLLALIVAAIFVFVTPYQDALANSEGFKFFILRWGHSLVWVALALSAFIRGLGRPELDGISNLCAAAGGILYAVFMFTLISSR